MAANEEGMPYRRALIVELSPWLRHTKIGIDVADLHPPVADCAGGGWARRLADLLLTWMQRARERRQLGTLGDNMLKDIGLTRADVDREAGRRFWQD
jgi:uncharacterized protein YjiS (DUF1127 family)